LFEPSILIADFERALSKAINSSFPNCRSSGCLFHFSQALWRRVSQLEICTGERKREVLALVAAFTLLSFISVETVKKTYKLIREKFGEDFIDFYNYFERNWMTADMINLWNFSKYSNEIEGIKRTNNCIESFHNQIYIRLSKVNNL
jgi:transposase-like protein